MVRLTWRDAAAVGALAVGAAAAGVGAKVASDRLRAARHARRGEDLAFGTLHSTPRAVLATDGLSLNVEVDEAEGVGGDVPTVVFVHGWTLDLDCWHYQRAALRGSARLILYDQRSHGRSGRSTAKHANLEQLGSDLLSVLEELAPSAPLMLVGHSMGGMTIMSLAAQLPDYVADRVVAVALMGTSAGDLVSRRSPMARVQPLLGRLSFLVDQGRRLDTYALTRRFAIGPGSDPVYADMTDEMIRRSRTHVFWDFYTNFVTLDLYDALAALPGKHTVVIGGTKDAITPFRHARELADRIEGAELVVCEGAGHMMMLEEHERVTAILIDLLEGVS